MLKQFINVPVYAMRIDMVAFGCNIPIKNNTVHLLQSPVKEERKRERERENYSVEIFATRHLHQYESDQCIHLASFDWGIRKKWNVPFEMKLYFNMNTNIRKVETSPYSRL